MPLCKIKLDASTLSIASFTWLKGLSQKNRSYLRTIQPQHRSNNCFYYIPFEALHCKYNITKDGETCTRQPHTWYKPCVMHGTSLA